MEAIAMTSGRKLHRFAPGEIGRVLEAQRGPWTPELVLARLIEAVRVADICVREPGPSCNVVMAFGFVEPGKETPADEIIRCRPKHATRDQIARMEETLLWVGRYILDERHRTIVSQLARTRAFKGSFRRACRARGWGKTQAYEIASVNLRAVAGALNRSGVPVSV